MGISTSGTISKRLMKELQAARKNPREVYGYAHYGEDWPFFNRMTKGIHENSYSILAGRPKDGKSMLIASRIPWIAHQAKAAGQVVKVVTLETTDMRYQQRMAALVAGVSDQSAIRSGFIDGEDLDRYTAALKWVGELPIVYLSNEYDMTEEESMVPGGSGVDYNSIETFLYPDDTYWWVLDHIGLIDDQTSRNLPEMVTKLSRKFLRFAHRRVGGMVVTHLNRDSAGGGKPTIDFLANSDQLTKDADEIFLLWRPFKHARNLTAQDVAYMAQIGGDPASIEFTSRNDGDGIDFVTWIKKRAAFIELREQPEGHIMPLPGEEDEVGRRQR